jgi:hypothetical protein
MTRRDYVLLARVMAEASFETENPLIDAECMRVHIAQAMAKELARQNGNFDRGRFLEACGAGI